MKVEVFNKKRKIDKKLPKIRTKVKKISDKNMKKIDDYFKDFTILPFRFIVINKFSKTPLVKIALLKSAP